MESNTFTTINELNKEYEVIREDILIRHGYEKGSKVRLKNAIMMYQEFNGNWLKITSTKTDMIDRIKLLATCNKQGNFKLVAMV